MDGVPRQDLDRDATDDPAEEPVIVDLGAVTALTTSQTYGSYLDGDSDRDYRHKPA